MPAPAAEPTQKSQATTPALAAAAPPSPPRVLLLMDSPANSALAAHFVRLGYSVEVVRDMKYCSTPLLKSARFIVLNPEPSASPYYQKVQALLKKMVPDRLFEQQGQDLLSAVKARVKDHVQPSAPHPGDAALRSEQIKAEAGAAAKELSADPRVSEKKAPPSTRKAADYTGPQRSQSPDIKDESEENALAAEEKKEKGGAAPAPEDGQMKKRLDEEAAAILDASLKKSSGREARIALTDDIRAALEPYVQVSGKLRELDAKRESILKGSVPEDGSAELRRQSSALSKPMMPERVIERAKENEEKAAAAKAAGKEFPPRKLPQGELYDRIIEMGRLQDELLLKRAYLRFDLAQWFANNVVSDILFKILRSTGVDSDYLYGTVYFVLALESVHGEILEKHQESQDELDKLGSDKAAVKGGGIGSFFRKSQAEEPGAKPADPQEQKLRDDASVYGFAALQIDQDLAAIEPDLVDSYWAIYAQAARLLLENKVRNKIFLRYIRAFLRFGLMFDNPAMVKREQLDFLLGLSDSDRTAFAHEDGRTNILYTDESMRQISEGIIPPSYDEDLELSGQGTPRYKYEKILRRIHASEFKIQVYNRELINWQGKVDKQKEALAAAEKLTAEKEKGSRDQKLAQAAARECKAEIARLQKILEKFGEIVKTEAEALKETKSHLGEIEYKPETAELAMREAANIRKYCKLLASRKEPFMPFLIRDIFDPASELFHTRERAEKGFSEFEANDCGAFSTDIANAQNPRKRVMVRSSPTIIILPCLGVMGFSITPSSSSETGRMVLPVMSPHQSPIMKMTVDMCSDFRYDSSKLNGGMDWMTSDTVVAGYAKVRWDYRKKGKEFREKAAIYNELPDRKNFRFHYRLYVESAKEAGKKLFFKCPEMYEAFAKYFPLPDGVQRLKKS